MIKRGWEEFRVLGCRRWVLILYDFLWFLGFEWKAGGLLYQELHSHCKISREMFDEVFNSKE